MAHWDIGWHNATTEEAVWSLWAVLALSFSLLVLRRCLGLLAIFRGNIPNGWRRRFAGWMLVVGLAPCVVHVGFLIIGLTSLLILPPPLVPEIRESATPMKALFISMEAVLALGSFALYQALSIVIDRPHSARDTRRDAQRDPPRDETRDRLRDPGRDLGRDVVRDPARDDARDSETQTNRDRLRDAERDEQRDPARDEGRDLVRDPARDTARDEETERSLQ